MNKNIKIGFFGVKPDDEKYLRKKLEEKKVSAEVFFTEEIISPEHPPAQTDFSAISIFVDCVINKKVLESLPQLSFIAIRSTGYDNIDLSATSEKNIIVSNVPSYGENTVAEFAFALILSLSRKICLAYNQIKETGSFSVKNLQGFDLRGKTLGVLGTGRIGRHVVVIAKGFGMNVVAFDPHPNQEHAKENDYVYLPFNDVLAQSDIITIHVPYMKETHHLIGKKQLAMMKKGAYLINTSRGGIVETEALIEYLRNGHLGGAGLDVLEEEGVIKDEMDFILKGHPEEHSLKAILADYALINMPNVIVTPHTAFNTREALLRILDTTIDNIETFIAGKATNQVKFFT